MDEDSLDHVEDALVLVEPNVVIGDCDVLKGDLLGVLEEGVRPPHGMKPRRWQEPVIGRQVVREAETIILPRLREEYVRRVRLIQKDVKKKRKKLLAVPELRSLEF